MAKQVRQVQNTGHGATRRGGTWGGHGDYTSKETTHIMDNINFPVVIPFSLFANKRFNRLSEGKPVVWIHQAITGIIMLVFQTVV